MSYDDGLKLLQNTGATVELVLSQILQPKLAKSSERKVDASHGKRNQNQNDVRTECKAAVAAAQSYQNSTQRQIKPKKISEDAKKKNECMATVKSMPDLPKVGLHHGQFNHSTHSLFIPTHTHLCQHKKNHIVEMVKLKSP